MKRMFPLLGLVLLTAPAPAADPKPAAKITYDDHILPMLRDNCLSCHGQDKKKAGLSLHNYTKLMEGGSSGIVVKPGDPSGSPLYLVVAHKVEPFMPPKTPTLEKEADLLRRWIEGGALENTGSKAVATKPNVEIGLKTIVRGKPEGPPPMPPTTLSIDPVLHTSLANAVTALASSPWAPLVAVAGQKQVLLYNSDSCDLIGVLPFPEGSIQVLKFSRNGALLLAGGGRPGKSGRVVVWSVTTGKRIVEVGEETDSVLAADISPDQTQIALGGPSKVVRIFGTRDGRIIHEIRKHTDWVTNLEYSPDGVLLATGDRNGGLQVWETFTGREYFSLRGHTASITEISWRADGNVLASTSEDATVRLWEMENGGQIRNWGAHGGGSQSVRFGKDGRLVSAGRDRTVKMWDGNGGLMRTFEAMPDLALRAIFAHDGARVIGGDWTGQIPVWQAADGKRVGTLTPNPAPVSERLETATKELAALEAKYKALAASASASQAQVKSATAELTRLQKLAADAPAVSKTANDNLAKAKAASQQAKGALALAQAEGKAKEILTQALTEAANKVKAASMTAKDDKALAAAATRAADLVGSVTAELTLARKIVQDKQLASRTADAAVAPVQQAATAAATAATTLPKMVQAQTAALKNAQTKAAADQAALAPVQATLNQARASVEKLRAVTASLTRQAGK